VDVVSADNLQVDATAKPYASNWEHLSDEFRRLEILIRAHLRYEQGPAPADLIEQLRGLVLTESEVSRLLSTPPGSEPTDDVDPSLSLALAEIDDRLKRRLAASSDESKYLTLPFLVELFALSPFEEQCLIACLAPEVARKYEKLYAFLQDDVTRRKPTVALLLDLFCESTKERLDARASFDPQSPLLNFRLLQVTDTSQDGPASLLQRFVKLDDRIVGFLLGSEAIDGRIAKTARLVVHKSEGRANLTEGLEGWSERLTRAIAKQKPPNGQKIACYLYGPYGVGRQMLAEAVSHNLGLSMLVGNVDRLLNGPIPFEEAAWLLCREAALQQAALCLENFDSLSAEEDKHQHQIDTLLRAAHTFAPLTFLLGTQAWQPRRVNAEQMFIGVELPIPDEQTRKSYWVQQAADCGPFDDDFDWEALAVKFRFTPGQIRNALVTARALAAWRDEGGQLKESDLYAACRSQSNQKLTALAQKIEPKYTWQDIVLPADRLQQLREICNYITYRAVVYQEWGFDRKLSLGKGLNALFAGPSGTGKTMAAEIMATELGLDLYKIDLSSVVSKYIGETEKNLSRIFAEAESSNAILFFDEADALFGRRSEVRDSHDRYANIEIGYLLQKMEEYRGAVILATNFRKNMDDAFVRRMHFTIEFPFPDERDRRRIWNQIWPEQTPVSPNLNLEFLARRFEITGGNIRNIALAAAFLAAADGRVVDMPHLIRATRREYQKMGKVILEGEFGEYDERSGNR
jgi:ATP-dependent 26S proteasome regulatory subunit